MSMTLNKHYDQAIPAMCYTRVIDRRTFTVRVFFPLDNAETMQQKIERMLHNDIMQHSTQHLAPLSGG